MRGPREGLAKGELVLNGGGLGADDFGFDVEGLGVLGECQGRSGQGEGFALLAGGFFVVGFGLRDVEDAAEDEEAVVFGVRVGAGVVGGFGLFAAGHPDCQGALAFLDAAAEFLPLLETAHDGNAAVLMHEQALIEGRELAAFRVADAVGGREEHALFYGQGFDDGAELFDSGAAGGGGFFLLSGRLFAGFAVGALGGLRADGEGGCHGEYCVCDVDLRDSRLRRGAR